MINFKICIILKSDKCSLCSSGGFLMSSMFEALEHQGLFKKCTK